MNERSKKIQFTLSPELMEKLDKELKETHHTKTTFLRKLLEEYFEKKEPTGRKVLELRIRK